MKEIRRTTYTARLSIFLAGCKEVPEIVRRLEGLLPLYKQLDASYVNHSKFNRPRGDYLVSWGMLVNHCNYDETHKYLARVSGFEPKSLCPLKDALEAWACFEHENRAINLRALGDWVYDIALLQLSDWLHHPEQKELCYTWRNFQPHISFELKDKRPPKFIYTLAVPLESYWEDALDQKPDFITEDGVRSFNPYAANNSESDYNRKDYATDKRLQDIVDIRDSVGLEGSFFIGDWNPESGETEGKFKARIFEDFKLRLDKHLEKVKKWYYEPSQIEQEEKRNALDVVAYFDWYDNEASQPPSGKKHKGNGDRDYLWTFQRYCLSMSSDDVVENWEEQSKDANAKKRKIDGKKKEVVIARKNVDIQVAEVAKLALLPRMTEKNQ